MQRAELLYREVRLACRALWRAKTFSVLFVLAIALTIGPNLLVAGAVAAILLQPVPFPQADRLVFVQETDRGNSVTYPDAGVIAGRASSLAEFAISRFDNETMTRQGSAFALHGGIVSPNYFAVLGVGPQLGVFFSAKNPRTDGIVISQGVWERYFSSDARAVGKVVRLSGHSYQILGVAPASFQDPSPYGLQSRDYWLVLDRSRAELTSAGGFNYTGIARIRPDVPVAPASAQIERITRDVVRGRAALRPRFFAVRVTTVQEAIVGPVRPLLWTLYAAVTLVLLLACANIVNMQIARNAGRSGVLAIRSALGATRSRILAELTTETFILAIAGTCLGCFLAAFGVAATGSIASQVLPRWSEVRINGAVLAYAVVLLFVVTFAAGVIPAIASRRDVWAALKVGGQSGTRRSHRVASIVSVTEVALATALVMCAVVVLRSFVSLIHVPLGFEPRDAWVITAPPLSGPRYASAEGRALYVGRAAQGIRTIPGVTDVAPAGQAPFMCCSSIGFSIPGRTLTNESTLYNPVGQDYFRALNIPLEQGRVFNDHDRLGSTPVAIVDEPFVRAYFGQTNVLGRQVVLSGGSGVQIVGVVGGFREDFVAPLKPMLYVPFQQEPQSGVFVLRTSVATPDMASAVANVFSRLDPTLPSPSISSYDEIFAEHTLSVRTLVTLFAVLACLALLIALSGVYAVTSYSTLQRRIEFGIRKALGGTTWTLLRSVSGGLLWRGVIGGAIGIAVAELLVVLLSQILYGVSPYDVATAVIVLCGMVGAVVASGLVPALKAVAIEPAAALRNE